MSDEELEEVQVLTLKDNKLYLPDEVRSTFNLKNGDKLVVYDGKGRIVMKVIRKSRT